MSVLQISASFGGKKVGPCSLPRAFTPPWGLTLYLERPHFAWGLTFSLHPQSAPQPQPLVLLVPTASSMSCGPVLQGTSPFQRQLSLTQQLCPWLCGKGQSQRLKEAPGRCGESRAKRLEPNPPRTAKVPIQRPVETCWNLSDKHKFSGQMEAALSLHGHTCSRGCVCGCCSRGTEAVSVGASLGDTAAPTPSTNTPARSFSRSLAAVGHH